MNSDVGDEPSRPLFGAFPRDVVPSPPGGAVGQGYVVHPGRGGAQAVAQGDQLRMEAQLLDRVHALAGLEFELLQRIQVPRVDDQRLLADGVRARAQRQADVRVVQIVGRTDADAVDPLRFGTSFEFLEMPVEPHDLGEEAHVEGLLVRTRLRLRIDARDGRCRCL